MTIEEFLVKMISVVESNTPSGVDVRVRGGDQNIEPDEVIVDYQIDGISNANGHTSLGGVNEDQNGYNESREFHQYYQIRVDLYVRMYNEIDKDSVAMGLTSLIGKYEYNSDLFHRDTRLWSTPDIGPSDNAMFDPDWYESVITVTTQLVHKTTGDQDDALEGIDVVPSGDEPDDRYIEVN